MITKALAEHASESARSEKYDLKTDRAQLRPTPFCTGQITISHNLEVRPLGVYSQ